MANPNRDQRKRGRITEFLSLLEGGELALVAFIILLLLYAGHKMTPGSLEQFFLLLK